MQSNSIQSLWSGQRPRQNAWFLGVGMFVWLTILSQVPRAVIGAKQARQCLLDG